MITNSLKVFIWGKEVGRLSWDERRGVSYFEYNWDFLEGMLDVFPLVASIKSPAARRPILGDKETKIYRKLPPFLADSLPDAWGSQVFECWRVEKGIRNSDLTPLDILSFIGKRGMGALEFVPESSGIKQSDKINLDALTYLAQRIFVERENVQILPEESITMRSLIAVGTSAGGRQPKAIVAIHPETGEIRSGQVAGQRDFEYCILKFGDAERSSAELEMAYHDMAVAAGVEMMPCRLMAVEGGRHFVTRRFDREKDCKLHVQTLAALYPEADSYEHLLMVCRKMRLPESTQTEVFRRMVFNILANNTDDHNKNFSFMMDESGHWRLSPAYDVTFIFDAGGFLPDKMHCLSIRGKRSGFSKADVLSLAKENGIRKAEDIIMDVVMAIRQFRHFATKCQAQERWTSMIERTLDQHLISWGYQNTRLPFIFKMEGHTFDNVHIEQAYKGNYHLLACIDGQERKYVIGKHKEEYAIIEQIGVTDLSEEFMKEMAIKFFLRDY